MTMGRVRGAIVFTTLAGSIAFVQVGGQELAFQRIRINSGPLKLIENSMKLLDQTEFAGFLTESSMSLSMSMQTCVPSNVKEFIVKEEVNIGDTLTGDPGLTKRCGTNCYTVKDSGDKPPFDPQSGDTLRFAYKQISSKQFSIRSRICGVGCGYFDDENVDSCGRVGLAIRDSLSPLARNVFISHFPFEQAFWTWRTEFGGNTIEDFNGSPDEECQWITIFRDGDEFTFTFNRFDDTCLDCRNCVNSCADGCGDCQVEGKITIPGMPKDVLVGLAVSTPVSDISEPFGPFREATEADFFDIEFHNGKTAPCE